MTIEVKAPGAVPPVSSGGSLPPRILRPNLAHINALRGTRPAILAQDRPLEIRKIAIVDDQFVNVLLLIRQLKLHFASLSVVAGQLLLSGQIPEDKKDGNLILTSPLKELSIPEIATETKRVPNLLISHNIDLLFIDFNMPGMCGNEIIRDIRGRGFKGIIVGLTALPTDNTEPFYAAGADLVLEKPYNNKDILNLFN